MPIEIGTREELEHLTDYKETVLRQTKKLIKTGALKTIIDNEPTGIAVYKPINSQTDLLHVFINPAYQSLKPEASILGRPISEVWPELSEKLDGFIKRIGRDGDTVEVKDTLVNMRSSGSKLRKAGYITFILSPISIDGDDMVLAVAVDTTKQVRAREALKAGEERYRVALSNSPVLAASVNVDLRYEWIANPHPAFDPSIVIGKRDDELAPADWVSELVKFKESVIRSGDGDRKIIRVIVQGQPRYYDITAEPLLDAEGEISGLSTAAIDVTDLKKSQDSLQHQAEKLAALHEIATVATSSLDLSEVSDKVLKDLARVFGLSTATVFLFDEEKDALIVTALWGYPPEFFQSIAKIKIDSEYQTAQTFRSGQPIFFKNMNAGNVPEATKIAAEKIEEITGQEIKSNITLPLKAYGRPVGVIALTWPWQRTFAKEDIDFFSSMAHEIAVGLENARLFEHQQATAKALREKDAAIRQAYTDVIDVVTGGKLILMTPEEIESALGKPVTDDNTVSRAEELATARKDVRDVLTGEFSIQNLANYIDPFGEAITNAVKHAGRGKFRVFRKDNIVQIKVTDAGPGINFSQLPKATLAPGYSTAGTLGKGFKVMLNRTNRVLLSTQPGNTTIVLETSL